MLQKHHVLQSRIYDGIIEESKESLASTKDVPDSHFFFGCTSIFDQLGTGQVVKKTSLVG